MAEQNNSVAVRLQKRINNLTKLRDKLVEKNGGLTEPQYSWLAKNNSDLVKGIRKIVKDSGVGEIKERWGDTQLSNPDLPWLTGGYGLRNDIGSFLAVNGALGRPLNPRGASTTRTSAFTGEPVVALLPEAIGTIRAWARNGKNYLYDLQKQQGGAGREYNQYIKTLEDIDNNLATLEAFKKDAAQVESDGMDYMKYLKNIGADKAYDNISNQIKDSALGEELNTEVTITPTDYTLEWINNQLEKDKKAGKAQGGGNNNFYGMGNQMTL